jgi:hypothetical protein
MSFVELWVFCEGLTQNLFRPAIFLRINQGLPKSLQEMQLRIELCAAFEQFARLINGGDLESDVVETPLRTVILS